MRRFCGLCCLALLVLNCGFSNLVRGGEYEGQIRLVPESTNLLVFINAQSIYQSPLAKNEDLKQKVKDAYLAGDALVPPNANRIVMAAEVDPLNDLKPFWDLSIIDLYKAPDVLGFARTEQAEIEHLEGHRLVQTHTGALVAEVKSQRMLTSSLATRQMFSRCLKAAAANGPARISPYLKQAADEIPDGAQVLIAMDLNQVFSRQVLQQLLGKDASPRAIECLSSITGMTCAMHIDTARHATIRLDFAQKVDGLGTNPHLAVQPVLEVLGFSDKQLEIITPVGHTQAHAVIIKGQLLPDRLREVFRKFESTGGSQDYNPEPPKPDADPKQVMMIATKKYFVAMNSMLTELKATMRRDTIAEMSERYSHKIDALPMLNVDPDMLNFSANVSGSLRYQAQEKREAGLRTGVRSSIPVYNYRYAYGPYGSVESYRQTVPDTSAISTQEHAQATQVRIKEWKQIDDGMVALKRTLTERYMSEF